MNSVTVGCNYRLAADHQSMYMNNHGRWSTQHRLLCCRVADFNMWQSTLSTEEMVDITGCKAFPEGDLISWQGTEFHLNSSAGTARR